MQKSGRRAALVAVRPRAHRVEDRRRARRAGHGRRCASAASTSCSSPDGTPTASWWPPARDQGRADRRRRLSRARRPEARRPGRGLRRAEARGRRADRASAGSAGSTGAMSRRIAAVALPRQSCTPEFCIRDEPLMVVDTFIRRPILASVCSLVIILAGAMAIPTLPIAQFPELAPPQVHRATPSTTARAPKSSKRRSRRPIEQAINGVEGMQYMTSSSGSDGIVVRHGDLRRRSRPRPRGGRRAEPRSRRSRAGCRTK